MITLGIPQTIHLPNNKKKEIKRIKRFFDF